MQRLLSTTALLGLLIATSAAFAITEHLKLVKSPIYGTVVSKRFSPVCGCATRRATVRVKLRHGDTATVTILDEHRRPVRLLAIASPMPRGPAVFHWNGVSDEGGLAPDGVYHVQFHLERAHRTILLPNPILLDTQPPKVESIAISRPSFSPDGDGRADFERIRYRFDSPAHAVFYLDGRKVLGPTWAHAARGSVTWFGKDDGVGLPAGTYVLWVGGVDLVGNRTPADERQPVVVRIRYIQLTRRRIVAPVRSIAAIGVVTDAREYAWSLERRSGTASADVFRFRVPSRPGRYTLTVSERGHESSAIVVAAKR